VTTPTQDDIQWKLQNLRRRVAEGDAVWPVVCADLADILHDFEDFCVSRAPATGVASPQIAEIKHEPTVGSSYSSVSVSDLQSKVGAPQRHAPGQ
jgi:hypothetical protein